MPGDKQYMVGPLCISGAIALQTPTSDDPSTTAGLAAITRLES